MSEERLRLIKIDDYVFQIHDTDNDFYLVAEQICNLLNKQQATISALEKRISSYEHNYCYVKNLKMVNFKYGKCHQ